MSLNSEIELEFKQRGASLVGFADISGLPAEVRGGLNYAISIAVVLDASIIKGIANGPTQAYYGEYKRANELLANLCKGMVDRLQRNGHDAFTAAPTVSANGLDPKTLATALPHKTAATRAGLGWIGKSALLITREYGAAVRLGTVITNAKLEVAKPIDSSQCGNCDKCVVHCPAKAISGQNWAVGTGREEIFDAHICWGATKKLANNVGIPNVICGICINVCPWTQKYITRKNTWGKTDTLKIYQVETEGDLEAVKQLFIVWANCIFELFSPHSLSLAERIRRKVLDEANNLPGEYATPKGCILLAEYQGAIAGCIAVSEIAGELCELKRLYVKPRFRRMGIGKNLAKAIIEKTVQLKYERMRLGTNELFTGAKELYSSLGFEETGHIEGSPLKSSVYMELNLV